MELSPTVFGALESVLTTIENSIFQVKDTDEKSMFWLLATVYVWDDVLQEIRPCECSTSEALLTAY